MNINSFKVSVIIPVYNDLKYFSILLNSLFDQSYQPYEVIIVDSSFNNQVSDFLESKKYPFEIIYKRK